MTETHNSAPQPITQGLREQIREMVSGNVPRPEVVRLLNDEFPGLDLTYSTVWWVSRDLLGVKKDILRAKVFFEGQPRSDVINELYFDKNMKCRDIATKIGCDYAAVWTTINARKNKLAEEQAQTQRHDWSPKLRQSQERPVY